MNCQACFPGPRGDRSGGALPPCRPAPFGPWHMAQVFP